MNRIDMLKKRQTRLREDIAAQLANFLIGTVARSPSMRGHNLTTKLKGKTVTLYVRKDIAAQAIQMSRRYQKLWSLMQKLSRVNWEMLQLENR